MHCYLFWIPFAHFLEKQDFKISAGFSYFHFNEELYGGNYDHIKCSIKRQFSKTIKCFKAYSEAFNMFKPYSELPEPLFQLCKLLKILLCTKINVQLSFHTGGKMEKQTSTEHG